MPITVRIYVEDPAAMLVDFDEIRLWRDTSPGGAFSTVAADIALVATQTLYTYEDASGDADSWYRYAFRSTSTLDESAPSPPFKPGGGTLRSLTYLVASAAGAAFEGVTTAPGSATSLVDEVLRDQGTDSGYLNGSWLRVGDVVRRTSPSPFNTTTGAVSIVRTWTPPDADTRYETFAILPPAPQSGTTYSWEQAVRDGLRYCWFVDQIIVGTGDGQETRFPLTAHPSLRATNRRRAVFLRYTVAGTQVDRDLGRGATFWRVDEDGPEQTLVLPFAPSTGDQVVMEVARQPDTPWRSDDYVDFFEDVVVRAGVLAAYRHLNEAPGTRGNYTTELAGAISEFKIAYEPYRPQDAILQR